MDKRTNQIFFALLRSAVHNTPLSDPEKELFSDEMLPSLYSLAKKHDIAHLIGLSLDNNHLAENEKEYYQKFQKQQFMAVYRYERINYELNQICNALEKANIPFIPLKGSVLRKYYPAPWMRTSCDIDVLIHEYDLDKAATYLTKQLGYLQEEKNSHDISFYTAGGTHIELHYDLIEDGLIKDSTKILNGIWDDVSVKNGYDHYFEMSDEMFYFYHIAHMAKHFENGGCGIRPFIDLWFLEHKTEHGNLKRDELLRQGNLLTFANAARQLSEIWLSDLGHDDLSTQMQDFILYGGVYGTQKNRVSVQQSKKGGRFRYALSRIFIPYDSIKYQYPVLHKHRWLTPFCEVRRWFKLVFCGGMKRSVNEFRINHSITKSQSDATRKLLNDIGL